MKTAEEIRTLLLKEQASLTQRWPIASLSLFGSVARGEQQEGSDIDLLIEFNGKIGWYIVDLAEELESLLGESVDLVSRKAIKPRAWPFIQPDIIDIFHA